MRLGKRILGLFAGIMCLGALASCSKGGSETTPKEEKPAIETIYVASATTEEEGKWSEYTLDTISTATVDTKRNAGGIVVCFKPTKNIKIKSFSLSFNNKYNNENLEQNSVRTYLAKNKTTDSTKIMNLEKGAIEYDDQVTISSDFTITIGETISTDKYFHFIIYEGGEWSNVRIDYEEVK